MWPGIAVRRCAGSGGLVSARSWVRREARDVPLCAGRVSRHLLGNPAHTEWLTSTGQLDSRYFRAAASALTGRAITVGVDVAHHADLCAVVAYLVEHGRERVVAAPPGMSRVVTLKHLVGRGLERFLERGPAVVESREALLDGGDDRMAPHA